MLKRMVERVSRFALDLMQNISCVKFYGTPECSIQRLREDSPPPLIYTAISYTDSLTYVGIF